MASDDDDLELNSMFTEPPRPPTPEPTYVTYPREDNDAQSASDWKEITIRLVGSHPLWGHFLWNSSLALASYLESNVELYKDRDVLELGAGAALPSIIATLNGARKVVITDYPDSELLENIHFNVARNMNKNDQDRVQVQGYIWGRPLDQSLGKFDLVILSDLNFNHSEHENLFEACNQALSPYNPNASIPPCALVFFTHHRPHLADRDMEIFRKATENGMQCTEVVTRTFSPMFKHDFGEESVRSTVHGWRLTRNPEQTAL